MAISTDTTANSSTTGTSLTYSHTCTGSNLALLVQVSNSSGDTITGVTYNGVSMTQITKMNLPPFGTSTMYFFYLLLPATGTNNIVISSSSSQTITATSQSYTGVLAFDNSSTQTNTNVSSLTTSIIPVAQNCWTFLAAYCSGGNLAASTGSTLRNSGTSSTLRFFDSNGGINPPISTSMAVTGSGTGTAGIATIMASFAPVNANFLMAF